MASAAAVLPQIASHAPELMTESLEANPLDRLAEGKTVIAMGPGLGAAAESLVAQAAVLAHPLVLDADALGNAGPGGHPLAAGDSTTRILTPHPGEFSRLAGIPTAAIQKDRAGAARTFATERRVTLVLKGQRTVIAFPDGRVWVNPTGTPAMGTGGSGDILTGLIAGFLAQFPQDPDRSVAAAVYLHGLAGQIGARELGEKSLIATDLLRYFPSAIAACGAL